MSDKIGCAKVQYDQYTRQPLILQNTLRYFAGSDLTNVNSIVQLPSYAALTAVPSANQRATFGRFVRSYFPLE
ncbi:MAG: hypothetical protein DYG89_44745 [Caldilinea sp. CFX5]|nr:hypothetical protein [Caldilinea sp. CFX5]